MSAPPTQRRLAAILAADVVGYSKLMAADEAGTLAALRDHRESLFNPETARRGGRIVKLMGDGTLVEFASVVDAVECALAIQQGLAEENGPIRLRIGINLGDIIIDGDDIYGDGVNIAARLEALAEPGGICISSIVHESLGNRIEAEFADAGEHEVKNIARPIRVFQWPVTGSVRPTARTGVQIPASRLNIAVAQFTALSDDAQTKHFAHGFRRALVAELGKFSVFRIIGGEPHANAEMQTPECDYVMEASIQISGRRIRITGQVHHQSSGELVWSGKYDGSTEDLLDFEDDAAHQMSGQAYPPLLKHAYDCALSMPPSRRRAVDHYICAFQNIERPTRKNVAGAETFCLRALELDPAFALVYESLAWVHIHSALNAWGKDPIAELETASKALATGITHDAREAYLRSAYGLVKVMLGETESGLREANLAVDRNPNDGEHLAFLGTSLTFAGRPQEALSVFDRADRLDPGYAPTLLFRGDALASTGRFGEAAGCFEQAVLALPEFAWGLVNLAVCHEYTGDHDKAQRTVEAVIAQETDMSVSYMNRLMTHRNSALREAFTATLRKAGLRE